MSSPMLNGVQPGTTSSGPLNRETKAEESKPIEMHNWLIHLFHVQGEIATCKALIADELKRSNDSNEFAMYKKGIIFREEGKLQDALETFQLCAKLNPANMANLKEIGKCLFALKRYRLALDAFLQAENVGRKQDWEIHQKIGETCLQLNDNRQAKEHLQKAIQLGKQEISYNLLVKILSNEGELHAAVTTANMGVDACSDSPSMLTTSGVLYLKLGEPQHAFERLSSALALDPANPGALLAVGCITQNHEQHDVALAKYKIAIQTQPNSVALWNNIGMCFYAKQKYVAAVTCLKRALWHAPLNWKVQINLGLVHLHMGQAASAFNFICAAVNLRPDLAHTFMLLGCALMELDDRVNAMRALTQALAMNADDPHIILNSGLAFYLSSQTEQAIRLCQRYQRLSNAAKTEPLNALFAYLDLSLSSKHGGDATSPQITDNNNTY